MCSFFLNLLFFLLNKFLVFRLPLYRYYAIPNVLCVYHLFNGGAKRVRTADLRLARAALSQLSYNPILFPAFLFLTQLYGGPNWSRTSDLTLIRGVL